MEDDPDVEGVPQSIAEGSQAAGVASGDPGGGLHFECGDYSVVALDHEVDLVAVMGLPMADVGDVAGPGRLLEEFAHNERLEQVPELAQRSRVEPPQPGRAQTQQPL